MSFVSLAQDDLSSNIIIISDHDCICQYVVAGGLNGEQAGMIARKDSELMKCILISHELVPISENLYADLFVRMSSSSDL